MNFDNHCAAIREDAKSILDEMVAILKRYPDLKGELAGHADGRMSEAYNLELSQRRARAVCDYFVQKGIDPPG